MERGSERRRGSETRARLPLRETKAGPHCHGFQAVADTETMVKVCQQMTTLDAPLAAYRVEDGEVLPAR
jgi:hypothetical protein